MKIFPILVIAVSTVVAVDPECTYDKLKACNTLEYLMGHKKFPQNISDVTSVCGLLKDGDACVKAFNDRCVHNPKAKLYADQIHAGFVNYYNNVCGTEQGKKDFLNRTQQCYSKPGVVVEFIRTHYIYVGLVEKIATYDAKEQLPVYCCAISFFRTDLAEYSGAFWKKCGQESAIYFDSALKAILHTPFKEVCGEFGDLRSYLKCADKNLNEAQQDDFNHVIFDDPPEAHKYENALPTLYEMFIKNFN